MSTERDNLMRFARELADPDWSLSVPKPAKDVIGQLVAIIEAKHRTITTSKELNTLPAGSVVLSSDYRHFMGKWQVSFQRWADGDWHRGARGISTHPDNFLPVTVLHEAGTT